MMNTLALAALIAVAVAMAQGMAQAPGPGEAQAAPRGNVVGGGPVGTVIGSGDDLEVRYSRPGAGLAAGGFAPNARRAKFAGTSGDGPEFDGDAPMAFDQGREAWMTGSGDEARITYVKPR
jgi:hypothetical protein